MEPNQNILLSSVNAEDYLAALKSQYGIKKNGINHVWFQQIESWIQPAFQLMKRKGLVSPKARLDMTEPALAKGMQD